MKKLTLAVCSLALATIAFGIYSAAVTFHNWPWTVRTDVTEQRIASFVAGQSKAEVFGHAMRAEDTGLIRVMLPLHRPTGPASERIRGTDLTPNLLERFAPYDEWAVGLVEPDRSLNLYFVNDDLDRVVLLTYRGPKE